MCKFFLFAILFSPAQRVAAGGRFVFPAVFGVAFMNCRYLFVFLLLPVFVFAQPSDVSSLGSSGVSLTSDLKGAMVQIGISLIPIFVIAYGGLFLIKYLIRRGLEVYNDRRMSKEGYERYEPKPKEYVRIGNRHYRLKHFPDEWHGKGGVR
jgi:hypothetical protein